MCSLVDRCQTDDVLGEMWMVSKPSLTSDTACAYKTTCNYTAQILKEPSDESESMIFNPQCDSTACTGVQTKDNSCGVRPQCSMFEVVTYEDAHETHCGKNPAIVQKFLIYPTVFFDNANYQSLEANATYDPEGTLTAVRTSSNNACANQVCVGGTGAWDDYASDADDYRSISTAQWLAEASLQDSVYTAKNGGGSVVGLFYNDVDFAAARTTGCGYHVENVEVHFIPPPKWAKAKGDGVLYDGNAY